MRRWLLGILLFSITCLSYAGNLNFPASVGYVNDFAHLLNSQQVATLNQQLANYDKQSTNQVVVVTTNTLNNIPIEDYSIQLAKQWGIGTKKHNNGVLLLIAKNDRKMRIEVGYGLEGVLTDALSNDIIRHQITPSFKQGNYFVGIQNGINAIEKATIGEYHPSAASDTSTSTLIFWMIILGGLAYYYFRYGRWYLGVGGNSSARGGWGSGSSGGGFSGGGGSFGGGGSSGSW